MTEKLIDVERKPIVQQTWMREDALEPTKGGIEDDNNTVKVLAEAPPVPSEKTDKKNKGGK